VFLHKNSLSSFKQCFVKLPSKVIGEFIVNDLLWADAVVRSQHASLSFSSGCHDNPDAFIRQLCLDNNSFHRRHPVPASCDDDATGSANVAAAAQHARRRDVTEPQRLPLADRQLQGCCVHSNRESRDRDVTAD